MEKRKVIAIINQKGGVGKTTTTANLGVCLARQGSITYKLKQNGGDVKAVQGDSGHSQSTIHIYSFHGLSVVTQS